MVALEVMVGRKQSLTPPLPLGLLQENSNVEHLTCRGGEPHHLTTGSCALVLSRAMQDHHGQRGPGAGIPPVPCSSPQHSGLASSPENSRVSICECSLYY